MTITHRRLSRSIVVAAATALTAGALTGFAASASASQGTPPPWAPSGVSQDANAVGGLEFVNSAGTQVTTGSITSAPFAAYTIGLTKTRTSIADTKATLFAYVPQVGQTPDQWTTNEQIGLSTDFPVTSAPAPANSATLPVETGSTGDLKLSTIATDLPNTSTTAGYVKTYEIRMYTGAKFQPTSTTYDYADITIDTTSGTWTQVFSPGDPIVTNLPASSMTISPSKTIALGARATLQTALKVKTGATPIAGATVALQSRIGTTGAFSQVTTAVTTANGLAKFSVKPSVTTEYQWTYAGNASHAATTSKISILTVQQPDVSALAISKSVKINAGASTLVTGTLTDTTTSTPIVGATVVLQSRIGNAAFANVATLETSASGVASMSFTPAATTQYKWIYNGDPSHLHIQSAIQTVTIK